MSTIKNQKGWLSCKKCPLHKTRENVVLGQGNLNAKIMFVGEGPGMTENTEGEPFIGASGNMLDDFMKVFDIHRSDVFIDNVVGCWPHTVEEGGKIKKTRKPSREEISACIERIQHSIYVVDPIVIVALGASALRALTGETAGITSAAGEIYEATIRGWYTHIQYSVYAMFHPAYILRQTPPDPNEKSPDEKHPLRKTYKHFEDMLETISLLDEAYYGLDNM